MAAEPCFVAVDAAGANAAGATEPTPADAEPTPTGDAAGAVDLTDAGERTVGDGLADVEGLADDFDTLGIELGFDSCGRHAEPVPPPLGWQDPQQAPC